MENATKHTAIISDPVSMWSKLAWDADVFRDIQTSYPDETQPLAYAAINVCIAATSLQDWVKVCLERELKKAGETWDNDAFYQGVSNAIPEQSACVAIANTSKHSEFRERRWTNGEVLLTLEEGDEDIPPGYVLYHVIAGSHSEGFAVSRFDTLCNNWWKYLTDHNLTNGQAKIPEWQQNKLHRIFSRHTR
tara:strand:- start:394 stop:966 length:573 start_codon:yes stop_codon:yes gene_type:complete